MIKFERYPHINDLMAYYLDDLNNETAKSIMNTGVKNELDAEAFSRFIWQMAGKMNIDEENNLTVLGSTDNSEMFPDLNYEIGLYKREQGFYATWERISHEEMND